ncbi:MAG: hypothetical protein JW967_05920 [Dehalococcoidales bacterium]|nr:hypothetical protein [Dehalococcoidales bacterium]
MKILIGTPIHRGGAFALDKFLANQEKIHQQTPSCELVFAACELDYIPELKSLVSQYRLRARVIPYEVIKPDWAKSRFWNIACGREALRQYFSARTEYGSLLFLDADMTFDTAVVEIMERELTGYDTVFCGYRLRDGGTGLAGAGCLIMTRQILQKIKFRCYEFKNGCAISEDNTLEVDLYRAGARIKKGFFLSIDHYINTDEAKHIEPQHVSLYRRITTNPLFRYCLNRLGILIHVNLSWRLFVIMGKLTRNR